MALLLVLYLLPPVRGQLEVFSEYRPLEVALWVGIIFERVYIALE